MSRLTPGRLLTLAVVAYTAGFAALSVLQHRAFNTGRFDLGNMVQAVWATANGHPLRITDLRGDQVSRLAAHFDPILAALAPLWWLWPSPAALLTAQAAAVALGAVPVFWLARKHLASERAALALALAYLLYPASQWLTLDDFHAVSLACPLLLFAFWYLDEDRLAAFFPFALAAALTREEVALVLAALGLWYAIARRRWLEGAAISLAAAVLAVVVFAVVLPAFRSGESSDFAARYAEVGGSPGGVVRTAFTDPWRLIETSLDGRGVLYLLELLLPLAGLALLAPLALIPAVPPLAINLLSATPTQTSIHFHYTATVIPWLIVATVLGAAFASRGRRRLVGPLAAIVLACSLVANYALGAVPAWRAVPGGERLGTRDFDVSKRDGIARRALDVIPEDSVVSASNGLGAHLSDRTRILSFPFLHDATWVAVDTRQAGYSDRVAPRATVAQLERLQSSPAWRIIFAADGIVILKRAGS